MMPKITVVIPLYNKEPHIKRTLNSVINQTIRDFEVIVIDDGSTDKGADIVKNFMDSRVHLIQQKNAGVSAARNSGINISQSDFIAFLDADDEWMPNHLETILRLIKNYPEAGAYATAFKIDYGNEQILNIINESIPPFPWDGLLHNFFQLFLFDLAIFCTSTICVPKKVFSELGDFAIGSSWGEDIDMWGRIALKYSIAFSREIGGIYHRDVVNSTCDNISHVILHPFIKSGQFAIKNKNISSEIIDDLNEYIAYLQIKSANRFIRAGNKKDALKTLIRCETQIKSLRKKKKK